MAIILKICFVPFLNWKILNLVGSIRATCRYRMVQIWNPRWRPWQPSSKSFLSFFSCTKRPAVLKLGSILVICRLKVATIVLIDNRRWLPSWKSILRFFSWTKGPVNLKLGRKYQGSCRSTIANIISTRNPSWPPWWLENLFWASSPEMKSQQTGKLVGSVRASCRSENRSFWKPRWPPWLLS